MRVFALTSLRHGRAARTQAGVGLVELMVTLLLGALLTAGIIALFNANRQSFRLQDNLSVAQEAGSFSIELLANDLRIAGYPGDMYNTVGVLDLANTVNDRVEARVRPVNGVNTNVNFVDDEFATIFIADTFSQLTSCNGEALPAEAYVGNRYWVRDTADGLDRELVCQGVTYTLTGSAVTGRTNLGNPEALMSGVDSFQVLYGVDTTHARDTAVVTGCPADDSPELPNRYIPGSVLATAFALARPAPQECYLPFTQFAALRSIRIGLLVRTGADVDAITAAGQTYTVLDRTITAADFPLINDGRIRRVFTTTVGLRNTERVIR
ncbi:MAG: PilW family protein [Gammaproteobacteria bacterium]